MKRTIVRKEDENTCLTYAVAFYFRLNPRRVPFFIGHDDYGRYLRAFFRRRGYTIAPWYYHPSLLKNRRKLYIVQGQSPNSRAKNPRRGKQHVVIYKGKRPFYDPNPGEKFLQGKPCYVWVVKKGPKIRTKRLP